MDIFKILLLVIYLISLLLVVGFSWLYLTRTVRAMKEIGVYAPTYINAMIKITIGLSIGTAAIIGIFLVAKFY